MGGNPLGKIIDMLEKMQHKVMLLSAGFVLQPLACVGGGSRIREIKDFREVLPEPACKPAVSWS